MQMTLTQINVKIKIRILAKKIGLTQAVKPIFLDTPSGTRTPDTLIKSVNICVLLHIIPYFSLFFRPKMTVFP